MKFWQKQFCTVFWDTVYCIINTLILFCLCDFRLCSVQYGYFDLPSKYTNMNFSLLGDDGSGSNMMGIGRVMEGMENTFLVGSIQWLHKAIVRYTSKHVVIIDNWPDMTRPERYQLTTVSAFVVEQVSACCPVMHASTIDPTPTLRLRNTDLPSVCLLQGKSISPIQGGLVV